MSRSGPSRIAYIDGLRAIAVLSVVACHAAQYSTLDHNSAIAFIFKQGCHGVDLFFVLSGFCLAYPTLKRLHQAGAATFDVAHFAARRIVRIIPPYYAMIALLTIVAIIFGRTGNPLPTSMPPGGFTAIDIVKQAFFLDFRELPHLLNRGFWSLQVEFRWYFAFPVLLLVWSRSPRAFGVIAFATLILSMTNAGSSDLHFLPAFMLGIVAAQVRIAQHRLAPLALPAFLVLLPLGVLHEAPVPGSYLWHILSFLLIVASGAVSGLTRMLSFRPLTIIGVASYSIYLAHEPTITFLESHGFIAPLAGLAGIGCGFGFWWVAERPFVESELRDRLISDFDSFLPRWFEAVGIARRLQLHATREYASHALAVDEVYLQRTPEPLARL